MSLTADIAKIKADAAKVKAWITTVADEAPAEVAKVLNDANLVLPVIEAFVPGSTVVATATESATNAILTAVEATGTATASNGLSVSLDQAVVNDVKAAIAALKKI
jgi:hypothetical protein